MVPDVVTGLPAARLSTVPGGQATGIRLVGLEADGWVGPPGSAMLVRIFEPSARLLLTLYHRGEADGPRLKITKLEGEPRHTADTGTQPEVTAYSREHGDMTARLGGWVGHRGSRVALQGFRIAPARPGLTPEAFEYQAVLGVSWLTPWTLGGQFCGGRDLGLPIHGLRVRLRGERADTHTVSVSATFIDGSEVGHTGPDAPCQAESLAPLEAFCITVLPRPDEGGRQPSAA